MNLKSWLYNIGGSGGATRQLRRYLPASGKKKQASRRTSLEKKHVEGYCQEELQVEKKELSSAALSCERRAVTNSAPCAVVDIFLLR